MALVLAIAAIALFAAAAVTDALQPADPEPDLGRARAARAAAHRRRAGGRRERADRGPRSRRRRSASSRWRRSPSASACSAAATSKLLAAGTLWLGAAALGSYLMITVLAGGLMAVAFVAWHYVRPGAARRQRTSLPYAIAIAAGGILTTAGVLWA